MCAKCSRDFYIRRWVATKVAALISWRWGEEAGDAWLWNETPYPIALPLWRQIGAGILLAIKR